MSGTKQAAAFAGPPGFEIAPRNVAHDGHGIEIIHAGPAERAVRGREPRWLDNMRLDTQARDRDKIFEEHGARLFVDPKSFLFLNGTTLEYEETLMRQGFVFQNPNAARNCGCGSSFTA